MYANDIVALIPAKDAGIRVRVEKGLRKAFDEACRTQGLAASCVLSDFMYAYAERHQNDLQGNLFQNDLKRTVIAAKTMRDLRSNQSSN